MSRTLIYRIADTAAEYEAIHRLNHRTFAEEIPQHAPDPLGRLVDPFHAENTYAVCLDGGAVVGMVAGRSTRPFSLDGKVPGLDRHLPPDRTPVEIRLLAVEPGYRRGTVLAGLLATISRAFAGRGCDLAVISGTTRALGMYRRMGFVPFGPLTGAPGAWFQSMYLTMEDAQRTPWSGVEGRAAPPESYLPGPVPVAPEVAAAFGRPPAYHRTREFVDLVAGLHTRLADLVHARHAQILLGSGTLANDVVAAQLGLLDRPGLVLAHGEFGERLADHAARAGLNHEVLRGGWDSPTSDAEIERAVRRLTAGGWLWAVHCETSTGWLTDLPGLADRCAAAGVELCVDAISSIGTVPLDLSSVYLATGASGKALGSYPGLSVVFSRYRPRPAPGVPRYLDLGAYTEADGIAFTQSSNLVGALDAALTGTDWPDRFTRLADASRWLHGQLRRLGLEVMAPVDRAAPGVCTIVLPARLDAAVVGARMAAAGFLLAYQSGYLRGRNLVQISLMGRWTWPGLRALVSALERAAG